MLKLVFLKKSSVFHSGLRLSVLSAVFAFSLVCCSGATIIWSSGNISSPGDVITNGVLVLAFNLGENVNPKTINGITFAADPTASGSSPDNLTGGGISISLPLMNNAPVFGTWSQTGAAAGYGTALNTGRWQASAASWAFTMNGLTPGLQYTLQLWYADNRVMAGNPRTQTFSDGNGNSVTLNNLNGPEWAVGTFIANSTTATISVTAPSPDSAQLNLLQLRVSPEPPPVLGIQTSNQRITLTWPRGILQSSTNVSGVYTDMTGTNSPYLFLATETQRFYRVRVPAPAIQTGDIFLTPNDISVLMYDRSASRSASLANFNLGNLPSRWWATNWVDPTQYMTWGVYAPVAGQYKVSAMIAAVPGTQMQISNQLSSLTFTATRNDDIYHNGQVNPSYWDRIDAGVLTLPEGHSTITIRLLNIPSQNALLKSLELVNVQDSSLISARVNALRSSTQWLHNAKYGLMFQWGGWGFPPTGPALPWSQQINAFDVNSFANMATNCGAKYVIWSVTWIQFLFGAPCQAIDQVVPGLTAQRDLVADLGAALNSRGVKLMLYYHEGWVTPSWWNKVYNPNDPDAKTNFITTLTNLLTEVGNRWGTNVAGWFFDDGFSIYYPAPFETITRAAKAGNPARLVAYNHWDLPRLTDFQDITFGEGFQGTTTLPVGSDGIFTNGPWKGLYAHGQNILDGPDWGINQMITVISQPQFPTPPNDTAGITYGAQQRGVTLSWDMNMFENGAIAFKSLLQMSNVCVQVRGVTNAITYPYIFNN